MKNNLKINCKVIDINISGVALTYFINTWVDFDNKEGGYYNSVKHKYDQPKIILHFIGDVDIDLKINGRYSDGTNLFVATGKNRIVNYENMVNVFVVPKEITLVSEPQGSLRSIVNAIGRTPDDGC